MREGNAEDWDTPAGTSTHLCNGLSAATPFRLELKLNLLLPVIPCEGRGMCDHLENMRRPWNYLLKKT